MSHPEDPPAPTTKPPHPTKKPPHTSQNDPETAHHSCPHVCDCWKKGFQEYIGRSPERQPHEIANQEAHALLVARTRAIRAVRRRRSELSAARQSVIVSHGTLQNQVARKRSLTDRNVLTGLTERYAAESARREPGPPLSLR